MTTDAAATAATGTRELPGRTKNLLLALLAFTITFLPALVLWGVELLAGLAGRRVQQAVHLALVGGLMAVLGLEVAKKLTPPR